MLFSSRMLSGRVKTRFTSPISRRSKNGGGDLAGGHLRQNVFHDSLGFKIELLPEDLETEQARDGILKYWVSNASVDSFSITCFYL
jgi:hypothetical protein